MKATPKYTLLVVDDEPDVCDSVHDLLRREFKVLKARSAAEGCQLMQDNEVHIIMTDQRMPQISGVELLSKVRAEKSSLLDIKLNADIVSEQQIEALEKVLRSHSGACKAVLRMEIPKRSETVLDLGDDYKVAASDDLLARIEQIFGARVAVLR